MADPAIRNEHLKDTVDMFSDIASGRLPSVSFAPPRRRARRSPVVVEARPVRGLCQEHPGQAPRQPDAGGQHGGGIITFDEGGGYYDSGFIQPIDFFGDGTRIPLIVVSPFTTGGKIDHGYADHVSILKFIERNWSLAPITSRSRDNLPNPVVNATNPWVPTNMQALTDLFDLFDFTH